MLLGLLAASLLGALACGTLLSVAPDEPPPSALPDAADFPEGSVVLSDGAVVLPDGAVVDGATFDATPIGDSAVADVPLPPPTCPGAVACERYIFVTSQVLPYASAAPASAAAVCTAAALASSNAKIKNRQFEGWTSTTDSPVTLRLVHGSLPYKDVLDMVIATNWADLTKGTLSRTPFIDENGVGVGGGSSVWTATLPIGNFLGPNCSDWVKPVGDATRGSVGGGGGNWSAFVGNELDCNTGSAHLYCIEK